MSSASLLQLLATQARLSDGELAERLDMTEEAVRGPAGTVGEGRRHPRIPGRGE